MGGMTSNDTGSNNVDISVLGSVAVHRDGADVELGPQLRRVLAALVSRHDSVVSVDRLVESVWLGEPPAGADGSIKTYVTRLRKVLDPDREGLITYRAPGYVLAMNGHTLDSALFDADLDEANLLLRGADYEGAVAVLSQALERWRGEAYDGFAEEDWARPEATRLEERRIEAAELLIEARFGIGDIEQAIADAMSLAEAEPLRERPRELLMRGLYTAGRQADALREFRSFRELLVEEAGLDPSADLVELENRIVRSDPALSGPVRAMRGYEIGERIGEGAFAVVHRAVQPGIERDVAIKIIRSELADRPDFVRRFEQEAQVVAAVEHPHVVPLYDYWRRPGAAYLVMRLLRGGSVEDALRARGPFSQQATADLLRTVGGALESAHRKGVVHRDVRPANLLLDEDGTVYLADFGIALPTSSLSDIAVPSAPYASPEMLRGEPIGVASDVLSLGVTTFELLTGRLPFADSNDYAELIRRQLAEPLPSARATRTDLPPAIDEVLARATAKAPDDRHSSVGALVDELVEVLDPATKRRDGRKVPSRRSTEVVENPYVGLHAFDERDANLFHGREALVTELVEAVTAHRFVVAVGPSGSGKSSAVRAGLVPALRRGAVTGADQWFVTTMVPGTDPIDAFETALLRVAVNPPASLRDQLAEPGGLLRSVRRVLPDDDTQILVVVDQFEELFTQVGEAEQDRFLSELAAAITAPASPLRVVATLRADHYDVPLRHREFAQLVTDGTVTVRPMTPGELERVVVRPAAAVGVEVEPALVAELVSGVTERPAALPLLQFSLTEVFERRVADVMLASTHHDLGGLTGAVAARADRIVDAGGEADEAEARRIFGRLVTLGEGSEDTRRRALRSEFGQSERTAWLLDAFASARLLTLGRDEASRQPTVEVAHEALLRDWPRLRGWLDDDRDDLRTQRVVADAANAWRRSGRDHGELARGGRLVAATELVERRPELLNDDETEWVAASRAAADEAEARRDAAAAKDRRQNRRLRQLLGVAAVLVVVAVVAAAVAVVARNNALDSEQAATAAEEAALTAEEDALVAAADAVDARDSALDSEQAAVEAEQDADIERLSAISAARIDTAPDVALLLALEAQRRRDDAGTQSALHQAIATNPSIVAITPSPLGVAAVTTVSRDGAVAVSWSNTVDGARVVFFDPETGTPLGDEYTADADVGQLAVAGDGSIAATAFSDGSIRFLDAAGTETSDRLAPAAELFGIALDGPGNRVALALSTGTTVVEVASGENVATYPLSEVTSELSVGDVPVALAPDGSTMAVAFADPPTLNGTVLSSDPFVGGVDLVDVATGEPIGRIDGGIASAVEVSEQGRVAVGFEDGSVAIGTVGSNGASTTFDTFGGQVTAIGTDTDGAIATATTDGVLRLWDSGASTQTLSVPLGGRASSLSYGPNGRVLTSPLGTGIVEIDAQGSSVVDQIRTSTTESPNNVFSDHPFYENASADGQTGVFRRLSDGEIASEVPFAESFPNGYGADAFYSSNGEWSMTFGTSIQNPVVVTEVLGDRRYVVDFGQAYLDAVGEPLTENHQLTARPTPDGQRLFLAARDLTGGPAYAMWIDSATSTPASESIELEGFGPALVLADDRVVIGFDDSTMLILDAQLAEAPVVVEGSEGFRALDQDEVTGRVLVGAPNGDLGLLDVDTASFQRIEGPSGLVTAGTFSPDGTRVAVLAPGLGVQVVDVATGRRVGLPMFLDGPVILPRGLHWAEDDVEAGRPGGLWVGSSIGPIEFAADPGRWREVACGIVGRELTADEWRTLVSDTEPQVSACS